MAFTDLMSTIGHMMAPSVAVVGGHELILAAYPHALRVREEAKAGGDGQVEVAV